jgi:hypothetical protein
MPPGLDSDRIRENEIAAVSQSEGRGQGLTFPGHLLYMLSVNHHVQPSNSEGRDAGH